MNSLGKLFLRFKNTRCLLVLLITSLSFSIDARAIEEKENQKATEAKLEQLKTSIKDMTNWLFKANSEKSGLDKELKETELKINRVSKDIRSTQKQIQSHTEELGKLAKNLKKLSIELSKQREFLEKQIQVAYLQEEHANLKLLLNTDNPQDIARQMHYFYYLKEARKEKIEQINQLVDQVRTTESTITEKTKQLEEEQQKQHNLKAELASAIKDKQKIRAKLAGEIKNNNQRLASMQADEKRLKKLLNELQETLKNTGLSNDSAPFAKQKYKLPWPSRAKVAAEFGSSVANGKLTLNGIRFNTRENDPITSIYSGRVIFSNWIRGFGLLIIIDHGNDFMSLYGNNKSLVKETGDRVRAGETIAIASEYLPQQESGLYFEIRKQGKPLNPRHWLKK